MNDVDPYNLVLTERQSAAFLDFCQPGSADRIIWCGAPGTGKSYLAEKIYQIVRYHVVHPQLGMCPALLVSMRELILSLNSYGGNKRAFDAFKSNLDRSVLVVLEELGKENDRDGNSVQMVLDTIQKRVPYATVLLIANSSPDELAAHYGEFVGSRLKPFRRFDWPATDADMRSPVQRPKSFLIPMREAWVNLTVKLFPNIPKGA